MSDPADLDILPVIEYTIRDRQEGSEFTGDWLFSPDHYEALAKEIVIMLHAAGWTIVKEDDLQVAKRWLQHGWEAHNDLESHDADQLIEMISSRSLGLDDE